MEQLGRGRTLNYSHFIATDSSILAEFLEPRAAHLLENYGRSARYRNLLRLRQDLSSMLDKVIARWRSDIEPTYGYGPRPTLRLSIATDTDQSCQFGATTVDHGQPMRILEPVY